MKTKTFTLEKDQFVRLIPNVGSDVRDVMVEALEFAKQYEVFTEFICNGINVIVSPTNTLEEVDAQWYKYQKDINAQTDKMFGHGRY